MLAKLVTATCMMAAACGAWPPAPQATAAPPTGMPIAEWGRLTAPAERTTGVAGTGTVTYGQSGASPSISGVVTDARSGEPLPGVTVVATAAARSASVVAITDEKGFYKFADLLPGDYKVSFFYADITIEQDNVHVGVNGSAAVYQAIDQTQAGGQTIKIQAKTPNITPLAAHRD